MQKSWLIYPIIVSATLILNGCSKTEATAPPVGSAPAAKFLSARDPANETIRFLEAKVKNDPEDFIAYNKLASEYLQHVRETGDITYLELAARAANASLAILPPEENKGGLVALTQVEFSSHDFTAARDHATQLAQLDLDKGYPYQFLGDALIELGQYTEAEDAYKKMQQLSGVQGLTKVAMEQRLARLALLHGDNAGASRHFAAALRLSLAMPDPPRETVAWCQWQLGETAFASGLYPEAEKYYRDSLKTFPDYFRSLASLGRIRAAQGDIAGAIEQYEKVVHILPDPSFVAALGDLYKLRGRDDDAQTQYALVEQIGHLSALNGTLYNRQLALFYADHDIKTDQAYALASKEYEVRKDVYGADALAWTAFKAGKLDEADAGIKDAMRLGTKDAKIFYHAAMIEQARGDRQSALNTMKDALRLNPIFDPLQAANARTVLSRLEKR